MTQVKNLTNFIVAPQSFLTGDITNYTFRFWVQTPLVPYDQVYLDIPQEIQGSLICQTLSGVISAL